MEKQKLYFEPPLDWYCTWFYNVQKQDKNEVVREMEKLRFDDDKIRSAIKEINDDEDDSGLTLIDYKRRTMVILVLNPTSFEQFCNTLLHENTHFLNNLAAAEHIDYRSERLAYIMGSTAEIQARMIRYYTELFYPQKECLACGYKAK